MKIRVSVVRFHPRALKTDFFSYTSSQQAIFVDLWHDSAGPKDPPLYEFLEVSRRDFMEWMMKPVGGGGKRSAWWV